MSKKFDAVLAKNSIARQIAEAVNDKEISRQTGEMYGSSRNMLKSADYIFCDTAYGDKERKGVLKVHKKTGAWELFPAK